MGAYKGLCFLSSFIASLMHDFLMLWIREMAIIFSCVFVTGVGHCIIPQMLEMPLSFHGNLLSVNCYS